MSTIGLIGDYNSEVVARQAIPRALELAAFSLRRTMGGKSSEEMGTTWKSSLPGEVVSGPRWEWVATESIAKEPQGRLKEFQGLWCVPASPYVSTEGALAAIRFAREQGIPFLGTCGGFQHALLEYARNVLGIKDAEHAETAPEAVAPVVSLLACSLVEKQERIFLLEGSRARQIYGRAEITEGYRCRFGLNREFEPKFDDGKLKFSGRDAAGEVRVMELAEHPFFFGTLFQPERSALKGETHPLIRAFVSSAECRVSQKVEG